MITGGSSGIGRACALGLAADGYDVTIVGRSRSALQAVCSAGEGADGAIHHVVADLADAGSIEGVVAEHRSRYGRLDVLLSNAGTYFEGPLEETGVEETDNQLDLNLRATHLLVRECLPMLSVAGESHRKALVAVTASIAGKRAFGNLAMYSASKAGVIGWTQGAHLELSPRGIQVTALCPGFVDTPMLAETSEQDLISPESVHQALRFLLSTDPNCMIPELQLVRPGRWT